MGRVGSSGGDGRGAKVDDHGGPLRGGLARGGRQEWREAWTGQGDPGILRPGCEEGHLGWAEVTGDGRDWIPEETIAEGAERQQQGMGGIRTYQKPPVRGVRGGFTWRFIKIICRQNCIRLTPSALILLTAPQALSPLPPICTL